MHLSVEICCVLFFRSAVNSMVVFLSVFEVIRHRVLERWNVSNRTFVLCPLHFTSLDLTSIAFDFFKSKVLLDTLCQRMLRIGRCCIAYFVGPWTALDFVLNALATFPLGAQQNEKSNTTLYVMFALNVILGSVWVILALALLGIRIQCLVDDAGV